MKAKPLLAFVLFCAFLVPSCQTGLKLWMINNAGRDITVVSITPAGPNVTEVAIPIAEGRMAEIGIPSRLRVLRGNATWNYQLRPVPSKFEKRHGAFYRQVLQIERDGAIFLLLPGAKDPVAAFPPQPTHFPLRPNEKPV